MRPSWRTAGILLVGMLAAGVLIGGCAGQSIGGAGSPRPPQGTTEPGRTQPSQDVPSTPTPSDGPPACEPGAIAVPAGDDAVPTPSGSPLITVTQGTNAWIASGLTQPFAIAVYPDGTAIRTEDLGVSSEPLPELTIGRLDRCLSDLARSEFAELATADLGDAQVTDQGRTTVTVHDPAGDLIIEVYALGIGDEYLSGDQRDAREQLGALIDALRDGLTQTSRFSPDRVRVSLVGNPVDPTTDLTWPLPGGVEQQLASLGGGSCALFDGDDAAAIIAALGSAPAGSSWNDGTRTVVLAIGALVPGQDCSRT